MYQVRETVLGPNFANDRIRAIQELIERSICVVVVGMPGVGVSAFLRYLSTKNFAQFIYIDTFNLVSLNKKELFREIFRQLGGKIEDQNEDTLLKSSQEKLQNLIKKGKVCLIFNRFDQLKKEFDNRLFSNIRSLRMVDPEKIVLIFTGNKPYSEIIPKDITTDNFHIINKTFYLKPYDRSDLEKLLTIASKTYKDRYFIEKALILSGGHFELLQLLLKSETLQDPLMDRFLKYQLKEIIDFLSYPQRKIIQKIAEGKSVDYCDPFLIEIGLVQQKGKYKLFTPLLEDYLKRSTPLILPQKENKLFKLLLRNIEKVVSKDEIFQYVWKNDLDKGSDWALNALIYRIRKNPGFVSSGYVIENVKKEGFILFKR